MRLVSLACLFVLEFSITCFTLAVSSAAKAAPKSSVTKTNAAPAANVELVSVKKIWDKAQHNGFPDLMRFQDHFFCVFRERERHAGGEDGNIRVLVSRDGDAWESAALLSEKGIDLRDPKLSITPDNRLMLVCGGSVYEGTEFKSRQPRVAFAKDGKNWTEIKRILSEGDWLWRVTWDDGMAYGVNKRVEPRPGSKSCASLCKSRDGLRWERICDLEVDGRASETTLRFLPDGTMIALLRRSAGDKVGRIGISKPPYQEWTWHDSKHRHLDGPNFVRLPDGSLWASTRAFQPLTEAEKAETGKPLAARTVLARFSRDGDFQVGLTLPSFGDTGYAGLVWHDDLLWMAYHSSHEGRTSIYLAKIKIHN